MWVLSNLDGFTTRGMLPMEPLDAGAQDKSFYSLQLRNGKVRTDINIFWAQLSLLF